MAPEVHISREEYQYELLQQFYLRRQHCDLELQCQGLVGEVYCHRFVLANVSEWMRCYLNSTGNQHSVTMILPIGCKLEHVKVFLDTLYHGLAIQEKEISFPPECSEIASHFNIRSGEDEEIEDITIDDRDPWPIKEEEECDLDGEMDIDVAAVEDFQNDTLSEDTSTVEAEQTSKSNSAELEQDHPEEPPTSEDDTYTPNTITRSLRSSRVEKDLSEQLDSKVVKPRIKPRISPQSKSFRKQTLLNYLTGENNEEDLQCKPFDVTLSLEDICKGTIENVRCFNPPYYQGISVQQILRKIKTSLQVIVGIKRCTIEDNVYLARPLAWTGAEYDLMPRQLDCYKEFMNSALGVPEGVLLNQPLMMETRVAYQRKGKNTFESFKARYKKASQEKCKELLTMHEEKLLEVNTSSKSCNEPSPLLENQSFVFKFTSAVTPIECENVIVLAISDMGTFGFPVLSESYDGGKIGAETLFNVWHNYNSANFQHHPYISEQCVKMIECNQSVAAVKTLLGTRKLMVCEDCGFTKEVVTDNDKAYFVKHVKKHKWEKQNCDCGIVFKSAKSKRQHMQLVHTDLDRVKCDQCDLISTRKQIATHIAFSHEIKNIVCDGCGRVCPKEADLVHHYNSKHRVYECKLCEETFTGSTKYKHHKEEKHGKVAPYRVKKIEQCEECDYFCHSSNALKQHILKFHTPNYEMPYKCGTCEKGFGYSYRLDRHQKTCSSKR